MPSALRVFQGLSILGLGVLTYLSLFAFTPQHPLPIDDKLAHLLAYTFLSFLMASGWGNIVGLVPTAFGLLVYGVILEALQDLIPYRVFEFSDMAANIAGILLGLAAAKFALSRLAATERPKE